MICIKVGRAECGRASQQCTAGWALLLLLLMLLYEFHNSIVALQCLHVHARVATSIPHKRYVLCTCYRPVLRSCYR